MIGAQVLVRLRTPDPQASSAKATLQLRLGFHALLEDIQRFEYYELDLPVATRAEASSEVAAILADTTLLANPNKEETTVHVEPDRATVTPGAVLIWDREGSVAARLLARLGRTYPARKVSAIRHGALWVPRFSRPVAEWPEHARRMALAETRLGGLLVNPNAEAFAILDGELAHRFLAAAG